MTFFPALNSYLCSQRAQSTSKKQKPVSIEAQVALFLCRSVTQFGIQIHSLEEEVRVSDRKEITSSSFSEAGKHSTLIESVFTVICHEILKTRNVRLRF
ncbi:hypothetical protein CEXT_463651 [Caerostris extrusa]|uniref:Uncharacterized protein n=1 Tax=Caerostris extrusa TaxID=172846 RepID=A0AAV4WVU1_CAEEX|nr:hypothetical protein CEXT_463651 [Caerostris extrusa]